MDWFVPFVVPALLAGLVAVAVTVAVERFGGVVGGLLGTVPTTIVPASWGIWATASDPGTYVEAMAAVPVGMLVNACFLYLWRVLPPHLPTGTLSVTLAWMVGVSLAGWALLSLAATAVVSGASAVGVPVLALGALALALNLAVGAAACLATVPAPKGDNPVTLPTLVARGSLAASAIVVATVLAASGAGFLSGLASVFPAIFLTTMVALWWSQGAAVPSGAVGPMMLGGASVGAFALLSVPVFPWLGPWLGSAVVWGLSVAVVTVPSGLWLRRGAMSEGL
ncbi:MAG: hypothetical protein KTR31_12655 [Myxococcales bacterium]|nr:hypothetical protein [Myxococcales bacterium]